MFLPWISLHAQAAEVVDYFILSLFFFLPIQQWVSCSARLVKDPSTGFLCIGTWISMRGACQPTYQLMRFCKLRQFLQKRAMVIEYDYALQSRQTNVRLQHAKPPAHVEEALLLPGKAHRFLLEMLSLCARP